MQNNNSIPPSLLTFVAASTKDFGSREIKLTITLTGVDILQTPEQRRHNNGNNGGGVFVNKRRYCFDARTLLQQRSQEQIRLDWAAARLYFDRKLVIIQYISGDSGP